MNTNNYYLAILYFFLILSGCNKKDDQYIVYKDKEGKSVKDINEMNGDYKFEMIGEGKVSPEAVKIHEQARLKGSSGDYDAAIALLEKAISIQPDWAYPHYDMAFTYLLKGEFKKAHAKYIDADKLEPDGFFTVKTAIWCLNKEFSGDFPKGTYRAYLSLESIPDDKKEEYLEMLIKKVPGLTPAIKDKAFLEGDTNKKLELINMALSMDSDVETRGLLLINKASGLISIGKVNEGRDILKSVISSNTLTKSCKVLAKEVLKTSDK